MCKTTSTLIFNLVQQFINPLLISLLSWKVHFSVYKTGCVQVFGLISQQMNPCACLPCLCDSFWLWGVASSSSFFFPHLNCCSPSSCASSLSVCSERAPRWDWLQSLHYEENALLWCRGGGGWGGESGEAQSQISTRRQLFLMTRMKNESVAFVLVLVCEQKAEGVHSSLHHVLMDKFLPSSRHALVVTVMTSGSRLLFWRVVGCDNPMGSCQHASHCSSSYKHPPPPRQPLPLSTFKW